MKLASKFTTLAMAALLSAPAIVSAQTASDATSTSVNKQTAKVQRKAERKAHRAKTNAELGALEKNGYQPGGDQTNYPQNLQNAQAKVNA